LLFNKEGLGPVPSGANVELTMSNDSIVNPHNWVLLNTGDEAQAASFSQEAATYPADQNHLPPSSDLIIAKTELLNAGANETDSVTFAAPATGQYIYVCTVPGHYDAGMWGYLTVE
jgi:azurin